MSEFENWKPRPRPLLKVVGSRVVIEPLDADRHIEGLFEAVCGSNDDALWTYIPHRRPRSIDELAGFFAHVTTDAALAWIPHVIAGADTGDVLGTASYMRVRAQHGSVEIGCIIYSSKLQRTPAATEAMYLMARHAFNDLGYRRYEWKCDAANAASRRAAERLGFSFEGEFRQDMVVKGRSRDTRWYSILDAEWPRRQAALEAWLAPENFDEAGQQRERLEELRAPPS